MKVVTFDTSSQEYQGLLKDIIKNSLVNLKYQTIKNYLEGKLVKPGILTLESTTSGEHAINLVLNDFRPKNSLHNYSFRTYYRNDYRNCKLGYLSSIGPFINLFSYDKELSYKMLDSILYLHNLRRAIFFTVSGGPPGRNFIEGLHDHFMVLSTQEIPIGYNDINQVHVCFYNHHYNDGAALKQAKRFMKSKYPDFSFSTEKKKKEVKEEVAIEKPTKKISANKSQIIVKFLNKPTPTFQRGNYKILDENYNAFLVKNRLGNKVWLKKTRFTTPEKI